MKKIIGGIIALLLIFVVDIKAVSLELIAPEEVEIGEVFNTQVRIIRESTDPEITGVEIVATYGEDKIEVYSAALNSSINWAEFVPFSNTDNLRTINAYTTDSSYYITQTGSILIYEIKFKVKQNATIGTTQISIQSDEILKKTDEGLSNILSQPISASKQINVVSESQTQNSLLSSIIIDTGAGEIDVEVQNSLVFDVEFNNAVDDKIGLEVELADPVNTSFVQGYGSREINLTSGNNVIEIKVQQESEVITYILNVNYESVNNPKTGILNMILPMLLFLLVGTGLYLYIKRNEKLKSI